MAPELRRPSPDPIGDARRAIREMEARLAEKPRDPMALYTLGMNYKSVLRFEDAERCFQEVLTTTEPGPYASMARIELTIEPERAASEKKLREAGGFLWALHRARRWMYVDPRGRLLWWVLILVPLLLWGLVWLRLRR